MYHATADLSLLMYDDFYMMICRCFTLYLGNHELCAQLQDEIDGSDDELAESKKRPRKVSNFHLTLMEVLYVLWPLFSFIGIIAFGIRSPHEKGSGRVYRAHLN